MLLRLPKLAAKASKAQISFPRLVKNEHYPTFLKKVYKSNSQSKRAFGMVDKTPIDDEFESQLRQLYSHDGMMLTTLLQEGTPWPRIQVRYLLMFMQANSPASKTAWEKLTSRSDLTRAGMTTTVLSEDSELLKLPGVGTSIKADNNKGDCWKFQSYGYFAAKAEKMNKDVVFTKAPMDDAFQRVVSSAVPVGRRSNRSGAASDVDTINRMLTRCLGSESDKYWKGRE